MRRLRSLLWAAALASLGCSEPPARLAFDGDTGVVHLYLPEGTDFELDEASPSAPPWDDILWVEVAAASQDVPVKVHGSVSVEGGTLSFRPSFPFERGVAYRARFDGEAFGERFGKVPPASVDVRFQWDPEVSASRPQVVALYPSGDVLPANLLRMYLHFSEPMRQGVAWEHVRLEDADGQEIELGLLELDHELWDPSGTRLTLLFDPGRLKSGLLPNREEGRPLEGQPTVAVVVDGAWTSADGVALGADSRSTYSVGPPDHAQPRPDQWTLRLPVVGTFEPLVIELDEPLDYGMLQGRIVVRHGGEVLSVKISADVGERTLELVPETSSWPSGRFVLEVDPRLEDPSGNSVRRPFETRIDG